MSARDIAPSAMTTRRCHQCLALVTDFVLMVNYPYYPGQDEPSYTFCWNCDWEFKYPRTPDATYLPQFNFAGQPTLSLPSTST